MICLGRRRFRKQVTVKSGFVGGPEDMLDPETIAFGPFHLLVGLRLLLANGEPIQLGSRAIDLLLALLRRRGQVITKDELMAEAWPGTVVEENSLHVQISALRKALEKYGRGGRYILTIPGRGYRFVAPISEPTGHQERALPSAPTAPLLPTEKPSIAVLPFTNISGDPEQDYFADGIVEDIITTLTRFPSLFVVSRNSAFTYKGRPADIKQVGRELGVRYVLEGSIRKGGNRVRISSQLIRTDSDAHVWADAYDRELSDIFALQDEITASVVGAILPSLQQAEIERARIKPPESLDAYDLYLRALPLFYKFTRDDNARALDLISRSLVLDPNFVSAVTLAENCWALQYSQGWSSTEQAHLECMRYARLGVQLDKNNVEALGSLARRTAGIERDYEEAVSLAEKAITLNPNSAVAWRQAGYVFVYCGESERALTCLERAIQLSPRDPRADDAWSGITLALIQLERDKGAVAAGRKAVQGNPNSASAWRAFAAALALAGDSGGPSAAMRRLLEIDTACTVSGMKSRYGYTEEAGKRYFIGLRQAGLPE
jgi:adenylate cyclase